MTERELDMWRENCERVQRHLQYSTAQCRRLRDYAATIASLVYLASGPEREEMATELIAMSRERHLQPGDLEGDGD